MIALLAGLVGGGIATRIASDEDGDESVTVESLRSSAEVVTAIRDLSRLEGTRFHIEKVIDLRDRRSLLFGQIVAEDAILLVAAGEVVAGVDLQGIRAVDVTVDSEGRSVRLTLPPPTILVSRLDNAHTYVFARETDLLAERSETLESRARAHAERAIEAAALEGDILGRARRSVRETLHTFLVALGFDRVELRFGDEME